METIDSYRRSLKRKNYSAHTVKTYMNILAQFTRWLTVPLAAVTRNEIGAYVDHLFQKRTEPENDHVPSADDQTLLRLSHQ